jgi:hypothetical protein
MFTPLAATLLMLLVATRDGYCRAGWQGLGLHRAGLRSWGLALLGPLLLLGCTYTIVWSTGIGRLDLTTYTGYMGIINLLLNLIVGVIVTSLFAWRKKSVGAVICCHTCCRWGRRGRCC